MQELVGTVDTTPGATGELAAIPVPQDVTGDKNILTPPADLQKLPPALQRKIVKMLRDRAPKHENFRLCHRKCKNFKKNRCFVLSALDQKKCWESWHNADGEVTGEMPSAVVPEVVQ